MSFGLLSLFSSVSALALSYGWKQVGLGDGGYVVGISMPKVGGEAGAVVKCDGAGGYVWTGTSWRQLFNNASFGSVTPIDNGIWEVVVAPSNVNNLYAIVGDPSAVTAGLYAIYTSTNQGMSWTKTSLTFTCYNNPLISHTGYVIANSPWRLSGQKIVVDPNNPLVCYVGIPYGCTTNGTYTGHNGCFRTLDGGATWAWVSPTPDATLVPGYAGMVIDGNSGTTTLSGVTVSNNIFLPCGGSGVWYSSDGGTTFSKVTSDPTPSTTATITTTSANEIIVVQVICFGEGLPVNYATNGGGAVTNSGTAALTWNYRAGPTRNNYAVGRAFEYWALAPAAGTYNISVNYTDGCVGYIRGSVVATATGCTLDNSPATGGMKVTLGTVTVGSFAVGQVLSTTYGLLPITSFVSGTGGSGSVMIVAGYYPFNVSGTYTANALAPIANQINVSAWKGVNTTTPFDTGGPVYNGTQYATAAASITTSAPVTMIIAAAYTGTTAADTGFSLMGQNTNYSFWSERSTATVSAGTTTVPGTGSGGFYIIDALVQSGSISFDTSVFAQSGPSFAAKPSQIYTAQIDFSGTYWALQGPGIYNNAGTYTAGSLYRNIRGSGVWDRIDGSNSGSGVTYDYGTPTSGSLGNSITVDPRSGHTGTVYAFVHGTSQRPIATTNGNAPMGTIAWGDNNGGPQTQTITSQVPWLGTGTSTLSTNGGQFVGDGAIDPVTGNYWSAGGGGVINYSVYGSPWTGVNISQGIEQMICQIVLTPPGATQPLFGVQDEMVLTTNLITAGASVSYQPSDANAWDMDFASNNSAYVCVYTSSINGGLYSGWSNNYGIAGSWTLFDNQLSNIFGGAIAAISYTNPTTANLICINGDGIITPYYTKTNATTPWNACSGVPTGQYIHPNTITKCIAADRINGNVAIWYPQGSGDPTRGFYLSTDGGVNFTQKVTGAAIPNIVGSTTSIPGINLLSTPGFADTWFIAGSIYSNGTGLLYYSIGNLGTSWTAVPGVKVTDAGNNATAYTLGKSKTNGGFPTLFVLGIVTATTGAIVTSNSGTYGFWRGDCNGTDPSAGYTWTRFGTPATDMPANCYSGTYIPQIWGDWNVYGRMYADSSSSNGVIFYNLDPNSIITPTPSDPVPIII